MGRNGEDQEGGVDLAHDIIYTFERDKIMANCSCGAVWSHSLTSAPGSLEATYQAHEAYFNKPKMETL